MSESTCRMIDQIGSPSHLSDPEPSVEQQRARTLARAHEEFDRQRVQIEAAAERARQAVDRRLLHEQREQRRRDRRNRLERTRQVQAQALDPRQIIYLPVSPSRAAYYDESVHLDSDWDADYDTLSYMHDDDAHDHPDQLRRGHSHSRSSSTSGRGLLVDELDFVGGYGGFSRRREALERETHRNRHALRDENDNPDFDNIDRQGMLTLLSRMLQVNLFDDLPSIGGLSAMNEEAIDDLPRGVLSSDSKRTSFRREFLC